MSRFNKADYGKILVPLVTPFKTNHEVDYEKAVQLAQYLIDNNRADTLVLAGTTGEFHTMTFDERVKLFKVMKSQFDGKIPLVAGVGAASTIETIKLAQEAERLGFETVMVVAPYYTKPNQAELYDHYRALSEAVSLHIMLYNIPIFTGVNLEPETVARLAEFDNIVALKEEAELNPKQMTAFMNVTPEDFIIYNGDDTMILEAYAQGGDKRIGGVISGASHLIGDRIRTMIETFLAGKVEESAQMQREIFPLFRIMGQNGRTNPVCLLKEAIKICAIDAGLPRRPLSPGTPEEVDNVKTVLKQLNLI